MTPDEVAEVLRIKPLTLKRWRADGIGPVCHRYNAKRIRYRRADVGAWIEAHRAGDTVATGTTDDG